MAHTFLNLGFETGADIPGDAYGWDQAVLSSLIEIPNFGYVAASPFETWEEGWSTDAFSFEFAQVDLESVQWPSGDVEPLSAEGFEYGWNNNTWSGELSSISEAMFAGGTLAYDDFESGWNNDTWAGVLSGETLGLFDAGANAYENFDFAYPQNAFGYWPALSEVQEITDGLDGSSPSTLPTGLEYLDTPRRIKLPAAYLSGSGKGFEEVGFKAGDLFWSQGSDLVGSNDLFIVQSTTNDTVTVQGTTWSNPGFNTTPTRLAELFPALFVTHNVPAAGVLDEHEYFDASAFEEMDTL